MRKNFLVTVAFTLLAIIINCFGSLIAGKITFPLYLDSLMTIFLVFKLNLISGIFCAIFTNLALSSFSIVSLPFTICHISTAFLAWCVKKKALSSKSKIDEEKTTIKIDDFLFAGFFSAISNTILGNLLAIYYFNEIYSGAEEIFNSNFLAQAFYFTTKNITFSIYISGFISNIVDKIISALVSYSAFKLARYCPFYKKNQHNTENVPCRFL